MFLWTVQPNSDGVGGRGWVRSCHRGADDGWEDCSRLRFGQCRQGAWNLDAEEESCRGDERNRLITQDTSHIMKQSVWFTVNKLQMIPQIPLLSTTINRICTLGDSYVQRRRSVRIGQSTQGWAWTWQRWPGLAIPSGTLWAWSRHSEELLDLRSKNSI